MAALFVLLPQVSGNGYYPYSPTDKQYGTQATVDAVVQVCSDWLRNQRCQVGVGDMSFQDGHHMAPHVSHKDGKCVDIRPLRKDQFNSPVTIHSPDYDHDATELLAQALLAHINVHRILFNDSKIKGVTHWAGHDNHLHVMMWK